MKKSYLVSATLAAVLFSGCGGGGSSSSGTVTSATKIGVFADAPVQGLSYKTATQSGFTDAQGQFKYTTGETVEFKLGTLFLGKAEAGAFITPYTISDNNNTATNIALILQNFDAKRSNTQILDVSKLKDHDFSSDEINITTSPSVLQNKITTLLATGSFQTKIDDTNLTLITETEVKKNMDDYIHKYETEHSKVTTPANGTLPNVSAYNNISIMKNISTYIADNAGNSITDPHIKQDISTNTSCNDFGFSGTPIVSTDAGITTRAYIDSSTNKVCSESDYSQASSSVLSGSKNILVAVKQSSLNTQTPTITGSGSTTTPTSGTLPTLGAYQEIVIYQNLPSSMISTVKSSTSNPSYDIPNGTSCKDFGFTNAPYYTTISSKYYRSDDGIQGCVEDDYTEGTGPSTTYAYSVLLINN